VPAIFTHDQIISCCIVFHEELFSKCREKFKIENNVAKG
jgi:hypothetical protein